jgi:hypothetical protein
VKNIYGMKLHSYANLEDGRDKSSSTIIFRVPGGWIYGIPDEYGRSWVLVPFNNEFEGDKP